MICLRNISPGIKQKQQQQTKILIKTKNQNKKQTRTIDFKLNSTK